MTGNIPSRTLEYESVVAVLQNPFDIELDGVENLAGSYLENDWLEIEISAGPQGDLVADWLALSELVLDGKKGP